MNNSHSADFPGAWRAAFQEMEREWERLHRENAQLREERDQLAKALVALMGEEATVNEEEILAQLGHEKPLREFLQDLRSQLAEK